MKEEFLKEDDGPLVYPKRLLPDSSYHYIADSDLASIKTLLARFTREQFNNDTPRSQLITLIAPNSNHLIDLSVNLMGIFLEEDIFIQIEKEQENYLHFVSPWDGVTGMRDLTPRFMMERSRGCFYFAIEHLTEPFEFERIDLNNNQNVQYKITPLISHKPVNTNFWHCEISWLVNDNQLADTSPKSLKRDILSFLKDKLTEMNQGYSDCSDAVPEFMYTRAGRV